MKYGLLVLSVFFCFTLSAQQNKSPEKLAQQQLDAYNNRAIEPFLAPYSDSVEVYMFPDKLLYKGKETMRKEYTELFRGAPDLHCKLQSRMVLKNTVIDHESVTFNKKLPPVQAVAIYTILNDKIAKVYFIMP